MLSAFEQELTIGLHPHFFKDIENTAHAEQYLAKHPQLKLIIDTAHLYLAGDDFTKTFLQFKERVCAIHLKTGKSVTFLLVILHWALRLWVKAY